jgi:hypothetical protein
MSRVNFIGSIPEVSVVKVLEMTEKTAKIQVSTQELQITKKIFAEVRNSLVLSEFITRVDFSPEDISFFLDSIEIRNTNTDSLIILASSDEVVMLNNIFNEICNGIRVINFDKKIGISKEEAILLLEIINSTMNHLYFLL